MKFHVCRYSGRIDLHDINNFRGGFTTDWVKGLGKKFLHAFYGVFAKNTLQLMEVTSPSRKAVTIKQDNYLEITDVF